MSVSRQLDHKKTCPCLGKRIMGTRGELVDTWLSRAIEQEAPHFKISDLSGGACYRSCLRVAKESIFTDYMKKNHQYQRYFVKKTNERELLSRITWNSRIQRKLVCNVKQGIRRRI